MKVFLIAGQSNAAGRALFVPRKTVWNTWLMNGFNEWEEAVDPLNRYSTVKRDDSEIATGCQGYGFGLPFASRLQFWSQFSGQPFEDVGLIVNARGGTTIEEWCKGGILYDELLLRANVAQDRGDAIEGVLWHQGESDKKNEHLLEALIQMIEDFRQDIRISNLPWVVGQICDNAPGDADLVNGQLGLINKWVNHTACVKADGFKTFDGFHFDSATMDKLGEKYADIMVFLKIMQLKTNKA